jgi:hypothetical protein
MALKEEERHCQDHGVVVLVENSALAGPTPAAAVEYRRGRD